MKRKSKILVILMLAAIIIAPIVSAVYTFNWHENMLDPAVFDPLVKNTGNYTWVNFAYWNGSLADTGWGTYRFEIFNFSSTGPINGDNADIANGAWFRITWKPTFRHDYGTHYTFYPDDPYVIGCWVAIDSGVSTNWVNMTGSTGFTAGTPTTNAILNLTDTTYNQGTKVIGGANPVGGYTCNSFIMIIYFLNVDTDDVPSGTYTNPPSAGYLSTWEILGWS